ncbi:hypothetical protein AtDm6_0589 [Acetobacter tropicalis]|uniref:Uncharacterized protein n=1 Tax=Acetobacter tropicalis TaxID=104102 RepID=A0A094YXI3_9PROT|nr:hypothetical protein AtDm6_0589 [Acetobacter tropicalis]
MQAALKVCKRNPAVSSTGRKRLLSCYPCAKIQTCFAGFNDPTPSPLYGLCKGSQKKPSPLTEMAFSLSFTINGFSKNGLQSVS